MINPFEILDGKPPTRKNVSALLLTLPLLVISAWSVMIGWIFIVNAVG